MPSAFLAIPLPDATVSSGGTQSSPTWDVSDAQSVAAVVITASTAPGLTAVGTLNSTDTTFINVSYWQSTAATIVTASSGQITLFEVGPLYRLAFKTTAASTGGIIIRGAKYVQV